MARCGALVALAFAACAAPDGQSAHDVVVILPGEECHEGASCTFNFGDLVAEQTSPLSHVFPIVNLGDADASLHAELSSRSDPAFVLDSEPAKHVAGGALTELEVQALPVGAGTVDGALALDVGDAKIEVVLHATRLDGGVLQLDGVCGFGDVPVDTTSAPCAVTLTNVGSLDVTISDVFLDDAGAVFALTSGVVVPMVIAPSTSRSMSFTASPLRRGAIEGSVAFSTPDGGLYIFELGVVGT